MAKPADKTPSPWPKGVAAPAVRALNGAGYHRLEDLTRVSEADLLQLHGMGQKALGILKQALIERGLSFAAG